MVWPIDVHAQMHMRTLGQKMACSHLWEDNSLDENNKLFFFT